MTTKVKNTNSSKNSIQSRNWLFTWFESHDESNFDFIKSENKKGGLLYKYVIMGCEKCPSTNKDHLQGYIQFTSPKKLETLLRWNKKNGVDIHWGDKDGKPAMGTPEENYKYCTKTRSKDKKPNKLFFEDGTINHTHQGQRSDLMEVTKFIKDGGSVKECADKYPDIYVKYSGGLNNLVTALSKPRYERPKCIWLWGKAGVGKTHYPFLHHDKNDIYIKNSTKWWEGYIGQEAIVLEDFNGMSENSSDFRDFLRLLDNKPYIGEIKNGHVNINSPYIYITCEFDPSFFWDNNALEQVESRLAEIIEIKGVNRRNVPLRKIFNNELLLNESKDSNIEEDKSSIKKSIKIKTKVT